MALYQDFKKCLHAAVSRFGVNFGEFIHSRSVDDFLRNEASSPSTAKELVANALAELCVGDTGQMDRAVCAAVVQFLNRKLGAPRDDQDQMRGTIDLLNMTKEPVNRDQYLKWADSWYR